MTGGSSPRMFYTNETANVLKKFTYCFLAAMQLQPQRRTLPVAAKAVCLPTANCLLPRNPEISAAAVTRLRSTAIRLPAFHFADTATAATDCYPSRNFVPKERFRIPLSAWLLCCTGPAALPPRCCSATRQRQPANTSLQQVSRRRNVSNRSKLSFERGIRLRETL